MRNGKKYSGVHTALVTPFKNGAIDYEAIELLIHKQIAASIRAITLFGTTGEGATIPLSERKALLNRIRKLIPKEIGLIFACGTSSTAETIEQIRVAEECGCDALQIVTPPYNRPSQEGLYHHFKTIHDQSKLEIFLYNIPGRTAVHLEKETIKRLFTLERVIGIKEASGNIPFLMEIIQLSRNDFQDTITVLTGDDLYTLVATQLGADGVVSVLSNLFPDHIQNLFHLAKERSEKALELHFYLKPFIEACFLETNPAPIKYMLSRDALIENEVRLPLYPIQEIHQKKIDALFKSQ